MAEQPDTTQSAPSNQLEGSTYEIIRSRLDQQAKELRTRLDQLNEARREVFGTIETELLSTERIATEHNCVPRDMVAIGDRFIFGYNVHLGLKTETALSDVFAVYRFQDRAFTQQPLDLIADPRFERDFKEVYRYYRHATFAKFAVLGPHLFMVFRVGANPGNIKTFKWAIQGGSLIYQDNRSDHEFRYPSQHEFEWIRTTREWHRTGLHPHISIEDRVFVETVGGDLTVKVENNTDSGDGIYAEPVDNKDQTLDDAEIYYALVGNLILLKIRPYQEDAFRYIVYSEKIRQAMRLDSIANACVLLPDDHGIIFADGYYLQTGEHKVFDGGLTDMLFERRLAAPNGEDFLYVFYNRDSGDYVLLRYNLISQTVETPIRCNGATFFAGGELVCFRAQAEPLRHHALQIWQTPYVGADHVVAAQTDSYLYKIGNRDLVRGMAECQEILNLIAKEDSYANLFMDLAKLAGDVKDGYFWVDNPNCFRLGETLVEIRAAATAAIEEYEKVARVRRNTAAETERVRQHVREIVAAIRRKRFEHVNDFVSSLADLRRARGETIALGDLRYIDPATVRSLEQEVIEQSDRLAHRCVQFLLQPAALQPYEQRIDEAAARIDALDRVADAKQLEADVAAGAGELEMLIDIVSNLKIDDATQRIAIIDAISAVFARVNTARAALKRKTRELVAVEGVAEFNSQLRLLNQSVASFLDVADTPEKCDESLTRLMVQIEELEGRFAESDEFVVQLTEKREDIYNAFGSRKVQLVEARNQRTAALQGAAERILKGIRSRVDALKSINDIHGYFASDLMIEKVRGLVTQLRELGDTVKVDDIQSRLKTIREDAVRQLKDRQELFVEGDMAIRLGRHRFSVNTQPLDLTTVVRDGQMLLHLTGTNFFEPVEDPTLAASQSVWDQQVVSENRDVYRAEYLAYQFLSELYRPIPEGPETHGGGQNASGGTDDQTAPDAAPLPSDLTPEQLLACDDKQLILHVQRFMGPRYEEAYSKGVHDHDAAILLRALLGMKTSIGLLRFQTRARAMARIFWRHFANPEEKRRTAATLRAFAAVLRLFPNATAQTQYVADLQAMLNTFAFETHLCPDFLVLEAAEYLFCELTGEGLPTDSPDESRPQQANEETFIVSRRAFDLAAAFRRHLNQHGFGETFTHSLEAVPGASVDRILLLRDWIEAFLQQRTETNVDDWEYVDEVVACVMEGPENAARVADGRVTCELEGLAGTHPLTAGGRYHLNYNRFMFKLDQFERGVVPLFRSFIRRKKELVDAARRELKLEEFRPRVLTSFVRNKLIDEVYLPLVGDNLAKQIGVAGEQKRTDRMGLLLVISPPGYGKTTLMEYIANRLGLIFMKINGPAIGHRVTSLDPAEAPNAAAREELQRLTLALEMGDNVMLYVDDIQHCHPEFLQKFISLCDAQRKIEGVYKGRTRTYDLRGRKVCVVMAGNPYTESGEQFRIPDMLSNRADIYNLGEIIGDTQDVFEMSYLENCLTSNPALNRLAARSQKDVYGVIRIASQNSREGVELEGNYSVEEIHEMVSVMRKLMQVRDIVLAVNREYIRSAAQADAYRTEPPFLLQGSYRNMNRIAEKVLPIMNDRELQTLIVSNYENDSQTLTTNAESNLLKFKALMDILSPDESRRWDDICRTFGQNVKMQGVADDDPMGRVMVQLREFNDGLHAIGRSLGEGVSRLATRDADESKVVMSALLQHVGELRRGLDAIGLALKEAAELAVQQRAEPVVLAPPPQMPAQNIVVQHRVPRELLDVIRNQFKIMQSWIAPLLATSTDQRRDLSQLHGAVDACLANYQDLLRQLEAAQARDAK